MPFGVKIYEYTPGVINSKVMLCDSKKAAAGTINLDYRSLYLHFECAALIYGSSVIPEIEMEFNDTVAKSREILPSDLNRTGLLYQLYKGVLKIIAPLM